MTSIVATTPGRLEVTGIEFSDHSPSAPSRDPVRSLTLAIPEMPQESYHYEPAGAENCSTESPPHQPAPFWFTAFQALHPGFRFAGADFVPDAAPVTAIAVYSRTIDLGNGGIDENTKIETPGARRLAPR